MLYFLAKEVALGSIRFFFLQVFKILLTPNF